MFHEGLTFFLFLNAIKQNKENIQSKCVQVAKVKVGVFEQLVYLNIQAGKDLSLYLFSEDVN